MVKFCFVLFCLVCVLVVGLLLRGLWVDLWCGWFSMWLCCIFNVLVSCSRLGIDGMKMFVVLFGWWDFMN